MFGRLGAFIWFASFWGEGFFDHLINSLLGKYFILKQFFVSQFLSCFYVVVVFGLV